MADYLAISATELDAEGLFSLLKALPSWRNEAQDACSKRTPIALKLSPDHETLDLLRIIDAAVGAVDALILAGGTAEIYDSNATGIRLSGAPVKEKALVALTAAAEHAKNDLPIIASGGILTTSDCIERLEAGAALVQLFTGFITNGPLFVADCVDATAHKTQLATEQTPR